MIETAVLLAAGAGTRLRDAAESKPLCVVGGKTLLTHALERLASVGITRAIVITGYKAELIEGHIASRDWPLAYALACARDPGPRRPAWHRGAARRQARAWP